VGYDVRHVLLMPGYGELEWVADEVEHGKFHFVVYMLRPLRRDGSSAWDIGFYRHALDSYTGTYQFAEIKPGSARYEQVLTYKALTEAPCYYDELADMARRGFDAQAVLADDADAEIQRGI